MRQQALMKQNDTDFNDFMFGAESETGQNENELTYFDMITNSN